METAGGSLWSSADGIRRGRDETGHVEAVVRVDEHHGVTVRRGDERRD